MSSHPNSLLKSWSVQLSKIGAWLQLTLLLAVLTSGQAHGSADRSHRDWLEPMVVAAYFAEWGIYGDAPFTAADIPASRLTHVIYSFAAIENGEIALVDRHAALEAKLPNDPSGLWPAGNLAQLARLKTLYPHLKTLVAVGGWTLSSPFSDVALTRQSRQRFARSVVAFLRQYELDGIDLDWEYPVKGGKEGNVNRPEDRQNYALLTRELRSQFEAAGKADGKHYTLTVATPAAAWAINNFDLAQMANDVDWFNVMAYDYSGTWESTTGHLAPLTSADGRPSVMDTLNHYRTAGVPNDQIVLGIPLYARAWSGVPAANNGLYQNATGPLEGLTEPGYLSYADLRRRMAASPGDFVVTLDPAAQAASIYNPKLADGTFFTLETPATMRAKLRLVQSRGLRGIMFWSIDGDVRNPSDPNSLVGTLPLSI